MMKKVLISIAMVCAFAMPMSASAQESTPRYEYKVIDLDHFQAPEVYESRLNAVGQEGWQVVGNERITFNGTSTLIRFFLMREVRGGDISAKDNREPDPAYHIPRVQHTSADRPAALNTQMHALAQTFLKAMTHPPALAER